MGMSAQALLAFGEMYRNGGVHVRPRAGAGVDSVRVLPEAWVRASWNAQGRSRAGGRAYGYGWWIGRAGGRAVYYAWGYGGQMLFVIPDLALTVVMTSDPATRSSEGGHLDALRSLLDEQIIPAAERGRAGAATPTRRVPR